MEPHPPPLNPASPPDHRAREARISTGNAEEGGDWLSPGRFALLLASLIFATFPKVLLGWETFYIRDFGYFGYPLAHYYRESFWRGEIPLWNPLSSTGLPFLAQWNTLVLYPGSILYLLFPLPWSLNVYCLAHQWWAGMGMYCLAFSWVRHRPAAAVAGMAFAFNGLTLNCLMWPNNIAGLAWMPWVVLCAERAWREGGKSVLLAALVGALQMLAGAPEIILLTWTVTTALWLGFCLVSARRRHPASPASPPALSALAGRFALVIILISGLSAAQLLPFFELLQACDRTQTSTGNYWAMPPWGWINLVLPLAGCYRSPIGVCFQPGQDWTSSYYPGAGVLALALFGAWPTGSRRASLLLLLVLGSLILALGDGGGLYTWLRKTLPVAAYMRFPIKLVVLALFGLPVLAALGISRAATPGPSPSSGRLQRWAAASVWTALVIVVLVVCWRKSLVFPQGISPLGHALSRLTFMTLMLGLGLTIRHWRALRLQVVAGWALVGLVWLDVLTHAPSQNPGVSTDVLAPGLLPGTGKLNPLPQAGESRAFVTRPAHDQVYSAMVSDPAKDYLCHRLWLFGDANLLDGIPLIDSFFSLYLRDQREIWTRLFFAPTNQSLRPLARWLGISQVTSETNLFEWEARPDYLPLVTAGQAPVFADRDATLRAVTRDRFDPTAEVYLPAELRPLVTATNRTQAEIRRRAFGAHALEFEVHTPERSLVVVAQSHYAPWKAYADGRPVPLWRANLAFQALEVPPGATRVRLVYEDQRFQLGLFISLGTLLVVGLAWRLLRRQAP